MQYYDSLGYLDDFTGMSHRRDTANTLFEVLSGQPVSEARLVRASRWFEQLDTPFDRRSFLAYMRVLQRPLPADSPLAGLQPRWRDVRAPAGGFSEQQASDFLQDYLTHLDPNLLFNAPITAGYARWQRRQLQQGFAFASETRQAWSLLLCDTGAARLRAAGRDLDLLPGTALLVAPGAVYTLHPHTKHHHWAYHWTVFHAESRWREWLAWPDFAAHIAQIALPEDQRRHVARCYRELTASLAAGRPRATELAHNLLEQIILRCSSALPPDYSPQRDPRVERAREFVARHFAESFTLADVAAASNLSGSRLAALFRAQCGSSVLGYRDELRMIEAARLLRDSSLPVAAVGASVGFADPAYFSRSFTRHLGISPRAYQRQR